MFDKLKDILNYNDNFCLDVTGLQKSDAIRASDILPLLREKVAILTGKKDTKCVILTFQLFIHLGTILYLKFEFRLRVG